MFVIMFILVARPETWQHSKTVSFVIVSLSSGRPTNFFYSQYKIVLLVMVVLYYWYILVAMGTWLKLVNNCFRDCFCRFGVDVDGQFYRSINYALTTNHNLILVAMRLKSVKNIQKITKSMKMVSASKFAKAERELKPARKYGAGANSEWLMLFHRCGLNTLTFLVLVSSFHSSALLDVCYAC